MTRGSKPIAVRRRTFLVAMLAAGCTHRDARTVAGRGRPVRIAVAGDSLALGTGASHPDGGFVFRAFRRVLAAHPGSQLDNFAVGGSQAIDVLTSQVPRLRGESPDIVVVCVGGNDVVRRVPARVFGQRVRAIANALGDDHPRARLVLCGVPDVALSPLFAGADGREIARLSRADDDEVRRIAGRDHARFVDLYGITHRARNEATPFLSDDRFHPSDRGYELLAEALTPLLLAAANA